MSDERMARLVAMANHIATAFETQKADPVLATAGHIQAFWPPPMRDEIIRHVQGAGPGLTATAAAAVARLAAGRGPRRA